MDLITQLKQNQSLTIKQLCDRLSEGRSR